MIKKVNKPLDSFIIAAVRALSGEITPNMRMVAFGYQDKCAIFRFYFSVEPNDEEREIGEIVALSFEAGLRIDLTKLDIEYVVTSEPLGKLDTLDFGIYRRWEPT